MLVATTSTRNTNAVAVVPVPGVTEGLDSVLAAATSAAHTEAIAGTRSVTARDLRSPRVSCGTGTPLTVGNANDAMRAIRTDLAVHGCIPRTTNEEKPMATPVQVVFDCADPRAQGTFWAEALHYRTDPPPPGHDSWEDFLRAEGVPEEQWNDANAVSDPDGAGPRLFFQRVPEGKTAKNRMHLDLNVGGGASVSLDERKARVDAEVARLKTLGATDERGAMEKRGEYWVRMNDPEGNEFCVQ